MLRVACLVLLSRTALARLDRQLCGAAVRVSSLGSLRAIRRGRPDAYDAAVRRGWVRPPLVLIVASAHGQDVSSTAAGLGVSRESPECDGARDARSPCD